MVGAVTGFSQADWRNLSSYYRNLTAQQRPNHEAFARQPNAEQMQHAQQTNQVSYIPTANRAAQTGTPVQPVDPAPAVSTHGAAPASLGQPISRGADPAEMAVRTRIQHVSSVGDFVSTPKIAAALDYAAKAGQGFAAAESKSAADVMNDAECQTCAQRKYQDGSDDPGVSFKSAAHIDPDASASVVRGHEQEHVVREQAAAQREGRKVISQSVVLHNDICPECGRSYVAGGTTTTTTATKQEPQPRGVRPLIGQNDLEI